MELSKDTIQTLKKSIKMARRQPHRFIYCAADESGIPALIISKRISSEKSKLRKSASKKQFCEGRLEVLEEGAMVLVIEKSNAPKFAKDLKMFFGKKVPELKKLEVLTEDELAGRTTEGSRPGAEDGTSPELIEAQRLVRRRMNIFNGQPQAVTDKQLDSLMKKAKACDAETDGSEFADHYQTLKKERGIRKQTRAVRASADERMANAEKAMSRIRSLFEQLNDDHPETPAEAAKMRAEIEELMAGLQETRSEVKRVQAMRS